MIFAVILAGGTGTRVRSSNLPKQFLELGGRPILLHTIDKFISSPNIDYVVVVSPSIWSSYTNDLIQGYNDSRISICHGGSTRQESLYNAIKHIEKKYETSNEDIIISHDAARPFVTMRVINDNITEVRKYGAIDTVIPCTDTIVSSSDGKHVSEIPPRNVLYQGQTPQSFFLKIYKEIYEKLDSCYLEKVTDAARILADHGHKVYLVRGEASNIKITDDFDLHLANCLVRDLHD